MTPVTLIVPDMTIPLGVDRRSSLQVHNLGECTIAFAISASSPGLVSIYPSQGLLPAKKTVQIELSLLSGSHAVGTSASSSHAGGDAVGPSASSNHTNQVSSAHSLPHFIVVTTAAALPTMLGQSVAQALALSEYKFEQRLDCVPALANEAMEEEESGLLDAALASLPKRDRAMLKELRRRCTALERLAVLRSVELADANAKLIALQATARNSPVGSAATTPAMRPATRTVDRRDVKAPSARSPSFGVYALIVALVAIYLAMHFFAPLQCQPNSHAHKHAHPPRGASSMPPWKRLQGLFKVPLPQGWAGHT